MEKKRWSVGKIIGTKLVNGSYNSENEDVNPFYNLNELTKLFEETISLLKKSGFTFDKNDIRLF